MFCRKTKSKNKKLKNKRAKHVLAQNARGAKVPRAAIAAPRGITRGHGPMRAPPWPAARACGHGPRRADIPRVRR